MFSLKKICFTALISFSSIFAAWNGETVKEPPTTVLGINDVYTISTPEELAWFARKVNSKDSTFRAILTNDIDLNQKTWIPIGETDSVAYKGVFDGQGHTISGLTISEYKRYSGLFGIIDSGIVKNLIINNSTIVGTTYSLFINNQYYYYDSYVGGVAGYIQKNASLENIIIQSSDIRKKRPTKSEEKTTTYIGGITGYAAGKIKNSINRANINFNCDDQKYCRNGGDVFAGGISGYSKDSLIFCGNYGSIRISIPADSSRITYVGGITGGTNSSISNVFNQGKIESTHYAAGIVPIISTRNQILQNFYVATDSIDGYKKAAFVYSIENGSIDNGYFDNELLKDLPLVVKNEGKSNNIYASNSSAMQTDSLAFTLDITNNDYYTYPSIHWSHDSSYPIFTDSIHNPIYRITFIFQEENSCSENFICKLDTIAKYTNYKGILDSFPQLENGRWTLFNNSYTTYIKPIDEKHKFNHTDTLIVASYQNCNEHASTNIGCCINYMLDFETEYASLTDFFEAETKNGKTYYRLSSNIIQPSLCYDDNHNGLLNWKDSTSYIFEYFQLLEADYQNLKYGNSSCSATNSSSSRGLSSSSKAKSSSSIKTNFTPIVLSTPFAIHAFERTLQISAAPIGSTYAIFDMQGRILKKGLVESDNFNITMSQAGNYIIQIRNHTQRINVK